MDISVREPEHEREPEREHEPAAAEAAPIARSRVRQALVCPYCRDEVKRRGTVACARRKCGALYHRECWEECATQYGGCAVYGCESRKSREISAAGYVWKLLRLFLAALLFPPRIARAMKRHHDEGAVSIFRLSLARARQVREWCKANNAWSAVAFFSCIPVAVVELLLFLKLERTFGNNPVPFFAFMIIYVASPFLAGVWLPPVAAFLGMLGFYAAKLLALGLRSELAGLIRADEGGGSVLGRLRSGAGKKADHDHGHDAEQG
jgi:hypothetical protein